MRITIPLFAVVIVSFGCSDSSSPKSLASTLRIVSGNTQHATVGTSLASAIVVEAVDAQSHGIAGLPVTFTVLSGGGSLARTSTTTNSQGQATTTWTLGTKADTQRVSAKLADGGTTLADTIVAVATAAAAKTVARVAGDSQGAYPDSALAESLAVVVTDQYQNPVPGVTVTWGVTAGGGSVSPTSSVTSATGVAKTRWTVGATAGANNAGATVAGLAPAAFLANAGGNPNVHIRIQQRTDTAHSLNQALHLSATATDKNGAVIPGAVLAWSALTANIVSVQASGNLAATVTSKATGTGRVIASYNGSADTVPVAVWQVPARIVLGDVFPDVVVGKTIQLTPTVTDSLGSVVPYTPVVWQSVTPSIATINSSGSASGVALGVTPFVATSPRLNSQAVGGSAGGFLSVSREAPTYLFGQVTVGNDHACALTVTGGELWCWGNVGGSFPGGNGVPGPVPTAGSLVFTQIATRGSLSCGITASGATYCNGTGYAFGGPPALSYGWGVQVTGGPAFTSVTVGGDFACGLTSSGAAYCWGNGELGELGTGNLTTSMSPVAVAGNLTFASISAGGDFACGLLSSGVPYCWGDNGDGQVGNGDQTVDACPNPAIAHMPATPCSKSPIPVGGSLTFTEISAGNTHVCALHSDGSAYCWGGNNLGELGDGTSSGPSGFANCGEEPFCSLVPVPVSGGLAFRSVVAGVLVTCGLDQTGHAYCWGDDRSGAIGNGQTTLGGIASPTAVSGGLTFTQLGVGTAACGIVAGGKTYCWGPYTLLGDGLGNPASGTTPVLVAHP